jgi:zinc D-Ala-D-Ala carboxypeptidase
VVANPPLAIKARVLATVTRIVAVLLVPIAFYRAPGRARFLACQWALGLRFPRENLYGLSPETLTAFTHARAVAFWRDGQLIGLTSGYRDPAEQHRIFTEEVRRTGSASAARRLVLPPEESRHVRGLALDVRPAEGARWLGQHGGRYRLYRIYDNEWWHFEYRAVEPVRLPSPDARAWPASCSAVRRGGWSCSALLPAGSISSVYRKPHTRGQHHAVLTGGVTYSEPSSVSLCLLLPLAGPRAVWA